MNRISIKKNQDTPQTIQKSWNEMKLIQRWIDMSDEDIARTLGNLKERRKWSRMKSMKKREKFV